MTLLALESSCDETAAAVVREGREVLSSLIWSQAAAHARFGGVVPEIASRMHVEAITQLAEDALAQAGTTRAELDAVAVTAAPGLIGALLVGVNFAKAAAYALGIPVVPVDHIRGHIAACYLADPELRPPFICAVVSGGHTIIAEVLDYTRFKVLGSTLDDAAGECYDKVARALGFAYPGGAMLDRLAAQGDPARYAMPKSAVLGLDMSFSGLKTHVVNLIHTAGQRGETLNTADLAASFSAAVSDMLLPRLLAAADTTGHKTVALTGGVAASQWLVGQARKHTKMKGLRLVIPPPSLCGDNAAMIGCQGYYEWRAGVRAGLSLNARASSNLENPGLC